METGIGLIVVVGILYFIPWLIALMRRHHHAGAIFTLNLFLGWSILGWVAALVWSMTAVRRRYEIDLVARTRRQHAFFLAVTAVIFGFAFLNSHAHAGSIGHAPYRGNAAPGMMNRGPEAEYFNRARPPVAIVPSYPRGGGYYSRPFRGSSWRSR